MRFGITILTDQPWAEAGPRWAAAEELGFDHAWTYDHLVWGGLPDSPWTTPTPVLGAAAQVTSRIGLGTLVASPNFRHPYQLFRDAQALEDLSDGRFLLGVGTGGNLDSEVLGGPGLGVGERVARFQEFALTLARLRDGDRVTHAGEWFSTVEARTLPPLRRTPLLLAGNGPRSVRFAARHGDGWVTTGPSGGEPDTWLTAVGEASRGFDEALAELGREPLPRYLLLDSAPQLSAGTGRVALSSAAFFEDLVGRTEALGFTDVVTHWPRRETPYAASMGVLEVVATEVIPRWR